MSESLRYFRTPRFAVFVVASVGSRIAALHNERDDCEKKSARNESVVRPKVSFAVFGKLPRDPLKSRIEFGTNLEAIVRVLEREGPNCS